MLAFEMRMQERLKGSDVSLVEPARGVIRAARVGSR